jgi:putative PEP-CTERM system TPR-repeat lipoprotein
VALAVVLLLGTGCGRSVDPATAVAEAQELIAEGKAGEARILLKNALAKEATLPGARLTLAQIAVDEGNLQAANDELAAMDADSAASPETQALKARVALSLGRVDDAAKALEAAGDAVPEPQRTILRANILRARGESPEALAQLRAAQQAHANDEQLAVEVAGTLAMMGNLHDAVVELDRYLATDAKSRAYALRARGDLKLRQGLPAEAAKDLRDALAAAPPNWATVSRLTTELMVGDALLAAGDLAGAREQIDRIGKTWPGMSGTALLEGQLALLEGKSGEAVDLLTPLAESNPENLRLQYLLIDALVRSGNTARATNLLEARIAQEPASSPARQALAQLWMRQGRPDRVIALLGEGADAELAVGASDDLLASARIARARAGEAISTLTAKLAANPQDPQLRAALAAAQAANGEPAAALATLGPLPSKGFTAEHIAARMAALLATDNDIEINRLVDRLLEPSAGADSATLVAAADMAQRRRRDAVASRLLDRAATLDATNVEVQLRRASMAFDARRYDEAASLLKQIPDSAPQRLTVSVAMARVAEAQGDLDGARKSLRDFTQREPAAVEPALMLAALELREDRGAQATAVLDALIAAQADASRRAMAANAAGLLLAGMQRLEEARTRFRQAVDLDSDNAEYWFSLGRAQLTLNDRPAARESFVKSARLRPDSLPVTAAAVRLSLEQKDPAVAVELAAELVRKLPESAGAWLLKAAADGASGRLEAAGAGFARSSTLQPSANAAMGEFQVRRQLRAPRPEAPLLNWLAREPKDLAARRMLGDHYLAINDARAAREQLDAIIRQVPSDVAALNNLAWLLRDSDAARAEQLALQARAIAPNNPAVADTLGMIYLGRGKTVEAVATLKVAADALPQDRTVQYHHALALHGAGNKAEARKALERALAGNVDFADRAAARKLMEEL